jgi:pimeloyl-ACP methyl ester carboxylesterase
MHTVFSEPGSDELIEEMIGIGMEAAPEAIATQETELDWCRPAALLGRVSQPTLIVHGDGDAAVPVSLAGQIAASMPNARLHILPGAGHRPDIRTPEHVNPLLADFVLGDSW